MAKAWWVGANIFRARPLRNCRFGIRIKRGSLLRGRHWMEEEGCYPRPSLSIDVVLTMLNTIWSNEGKSVRTNNNGSIFICFGSFVFRSIFKYLPPKTNSAVRRGLAWTSDGQTNGENFIPFVCPSPWLLDGSGCRRCRR